MELKRCSASDVGIIYSPYQLDCTEYPFACTAITKSVDILVQAFNWM